MDKIVIGNYLSDFVIADQNVLLPGDWYYTEHESLLAPDEQVLAWHYAAGWRAVSTTGSGSTILYRMERRKLYTEAALNALVASYTNAYNTGRYINDARYDDIVALYAAAMDKSEDELNDLEDDEDAYEVLVQTIMGSMYSEYTTHSTNTSDALDDWGSSERTRIDNDFDAREAAQEASMRAIGIYTSTTYQAMNNGLTRDEAEADGILEDKITQRQLEQDNLLYNQRVEIRTKVLDARNRVMQILHKQGNDRTQLRNAVVEAISNFAERRTDSYPDISEIGKITAALGASDTVGFTP